MPLLQEPSSSPSRPDFSPEISEERTRRIRIKNRRKLYLDHHPSYFTSPDLELSDPLLYDRCIRRFQSAAEREADGKAKGFSGVLEADLIRSEAKFAALHNITDPSVEPRGSLSASSSQPSKADIPYVSYLRGSNGEVLPEEEDEIPQSKEEGMERWRFEMTLKFLRGEDREFEYEAVDESEEWDVVEGREEEERWFEDEEPEWVGDEEEKEGEDKKGTGGETGVQDF